MAVSAIVTCPACKKKFKGREGLEGKRIRCPACSHAFIVQAVAVDKPVSAPEPEPPPASDLKPETEPTPGTKGPTARKVLWNEEEESQGDNPYDVTHLDIAPRCPHCANLMESAEAVICLHCGYNTQTRELPQVKKTVAHTGGEWFMYLLPGILGVVGVILTVNFDFFFCLALPEMVQNSWMRLLDHESMRMWVVIISLFGIWAMGYFGFKRLVLEPVPPEKVKD